MAGTDRASTRRSDSRRRRSAFFRGAFMLLIALGTSFALGFFVLSRMIPPTAANAQDSGYTPPPAHQAAPRASVPAPHTTVVKPPAPASAPPAGPELLPDSDAPKQNGAGGPRQGSTDSGTTAATPGDDSGDNGSRQRRGVAPGDTGAVQAPATPDDSHSRTGAADAGANQPAADAPAKSGLYRVQIGVYSTREKADEIARSAADKGIATRVQVMTRDGRTLYRVQHSAHRTRAGAELELQKVLDAGFDGSIANPT